MTDKSIIATWSREQLESAFTQREEQLEQSLSRSESVEQGMLTDMYEARTERDSLKEQLAEAHAEFREMRLKLEAQEKEIGEFQDEVRDLVIKKSGAPDSAIDGAGSDAGWQEFTLAEIGQGFSHIKEQLEKAQAYSIEVNRQYTICESALGDVKRDREHIREQLEKAQACCGHQRAVLQECDLYFGSCSASIARLVHDQLQATDCGKDLLATVERLEVENRELLDALELAKQVTAHGFIPNPNTTDINQTHVDLHSVIDKALHRDPKDTHDH